MAYSVSQDFKTKIKDETVQKSCLVLYNDLFFSSSDFTDDGVEFNQYFNVTDDLTFGGTPSDTLSFSVVANGTLKNFPFGKAKAYLGVETKRTTDISSELAHVVIPNGNSFVAYYATVSGLYMQVGASPATLIDDGQYTGLIALSPWGVIAIGNNKSIMIQSGSVGSFYPERFMVEKCRSGLSVYFYKKNGGYYGMSWDGRYKHEFEYVPMGIYNITKPRSSVGKVVTIQDAYDNMTLLDVNAGEFLSTLPPFSISLGQLLTKICQYVGVSLATTSFPHSDYLYNPAKLETSHTLRDIVGWIAQKAQRVAHFNRFGELELVWVSPYSEGNSEVLMPSDIGMDNYSAAEYYTPKVTGVVLHIDEQNTISYGTNRNVYEIEQNPFVKSLWSSDLLRYLAIPTYKPFECDVLEADPSIDIGEIVRIKPNGDETQMLVNVYGEAYGFFSSLVNPLNDKVLTDENDSILVRQGALAVKAQYYDIPLMNRTIYFIGAIRATYSATGGIIREVSAATAFTPQEGA